MTWLTSSDSIARYRDALRRAAADDVVFASFRIESGVREIIEGIPDAAGADYHAKLRQHNSELLTGRWAEILENDRVGSPRLMYVSEGAVAPTTMRYAWNVCDMETRGVALDGADVVEVGGGYGGLCRMIHAFHKPRSYSIVDLPEALALAKRYLDCYGISFEAVPDNSLPDVALIDTFISNYALTELTRDVQDVYVDRLMSRAPHGYVTYNSQPHNAAEQFSLDQLAASVLGTSTKEIVDENVKHSECRVLIWVPS